MVQREPRGPKGLKKNWKLIDRHLFDLKLENTEQQDKIWNYLNGLTGDPSFNHEVLRIRKKFKLPKNGLSRKSKNTEIRKNAQSLNMLIEVGKLTDVLGLDMQWSMVIADYIIYNEWKWHFSNWGLIQIDDMFNFLNNIKYEHELNILKKNSKNRPISISISPYVSERNIINFVKEVYKSDIEPLQKKYQEPEVKIGKFNIRDDFKAKRNTFIFQNRAYGPKKIQELVSAKFDEFLETSYISKIIASKKRTEK